MRLAGTGRLFALPVLKWWSQVKTAGSAIYANRHYLALYKAKHPNRLASAVNGPCQIIGDIYIHPSASVHPTAVVKKFYYIFFVLIKIIKYNFIRQ